jgi:hypothetical protein
MGDEVIDLLKRAVGGDIDNEAARKKALELARLLESKVLPNQKIILNVGYWPFKIPVHTRDFYFFLFVSNVSYHLTANRRPKTPFIGDFFVSLKTPCPHMFADLRVPKVSKQLGISVFRQRFCKSTVIERAFASTRCRDVLRRVSLSRIQQCHLSPVQFSAIAPVEPLKETVREVSLFQALMTTVIEEARERYKDVLDL